MTVYLLAGGKLVVQTYGSNIWYGTANTNTIIAVVDENPVDTGRRIDVVQGRCDITSHRRQYDVFLSSCARWEGNDQDLTQSISTS